MKKKFINPFTDYGFKRLLGSEEAKDILKAFLNSLLADEVIVDLTLRNVEMLGLKPESRRAVFDVFCENEKGEFFVVEMQQSLQKYFSDRVLYYASFVIQQQMTLARERKKEQKAEQEESKKQPVWMYQLDKLYVISLLNYEMDKQHKEKYRWDVVRMERELKQPFSVTLQEVYLELPKFNKPLSECDSLHEKIIYVLKNIEILETMPQELNDPIFQKLKNLADVSRMTPEERWAYEMSLAAEDDLSDAMNTQYEQGIEQGKKEGKIEGKIEGIKEGEKVGIRKVALQMLKKGLPLDLISQCTGFSTQELALMN